MLRQDGVEHGLTVADANAAAVRKLRNAAVAQDVPAVRTLRKSPRFTFTAVLSLGLGTGIFAEGFYRAQDFDSRL
jgi:hypothetical protein